MTVDLSPFQPYGNDMPALVETVNQACSTAACRPP